MRGNGVEKLCDDRGDCAKVRRPAPGRTPAEHVREPLDGDGGREALRIDLLHARGIEQIDTLALGQRRIPSLVSRVGIEVLRRPELRRVHEERHHDDVALTPGGAKKRQMTLVHAAHRRHQPDRRAGATGLHKRFTEVLLRAGDPHPGTPCVPRARARSASAR